MIDLDLDGLKKNGKEYISSLNDLNKGLQKNIESMANSPEGKIIADKIKTMFLFSKNGDMAGFNKIHQELIKTEAEIIKNGNTAHTDK